MKQEMDHPGQPLVYILIVNWNGWSDTIECLESLFRSEYSSYRILVCDNCSQDQSVERIIDWAEGRLDPLVAPGNPLRDLSVPPVGKPLRYRVYDRKDAEQGGEIADSDSQLIIVRTGANLGFAGGNNVGLKYALSRGDLCYAWLLNNDTVVDRSALAELVTRMKNVPAAGICGSKLIYYGDPTLIQAHGGGTYGRIGAASKALGAMSHRDDIVMEDAVEASLDYIIGASMLVSRKFLTEIGLMCEDYFLYFEELDWAYRGKRKFSMGYASRSIVYHKEGASIGSNADPTLKSELSDYYGVANRLLFTRKHAPLFYPFVYLSLFGVVLNRLRRRQFGRAKMVLAIMLGKRLLR